MLFQPLDEKKLVGVYANGEVYRDIPQGATGTWRFCDYLSDLDLVYASLYCGGKTLTEACPSELLVCWQNTSEKIRAHISACRSSKIDLHSYGVLEMIPVKLLKEFLDLKNKITEHVINTYPKPENYNFLCDLERLLGKIRRNKLNINLDSLKSHLTTAQARSSYRRIEASRPVIDYNPHKTKTGRLTSKKGSFPILTLDRKSRIAVEPNNDFFLELDFNAAELRTLLALCGKKQPQEDIHEWNIKNVFSGSETREQAKKKVFAWLYNPERQDSNLDRVYDRNAVVHKYFDGSYVNTFFSRVIPADEKHALNYIIQSTTSDLLLKRAIKVDKMLESRKSKIAFTLHDSLIIDFSMEDRSIMNDVVDEFGSTELGEYLVNVSAGKNFGSMRSLKI